MHTRRTASQQQLAAPLPPLPAELQCCILGCLIHDYRDPSDNGRDYELYPFKTTLGWLLSLGTVCKAWRLQLSGSAVVLRRMRLERLIKVVMAHDYVHHIQSATPKATRARKWLPGPVQLPFQPSSPSLHLVVCKKLSAAERRGLPATALVLVVDGWELLERRLLLPLLEDVVVLDERHNAAFVVKVCMAGLAKKRGAGHRWQQGQQQRQQQAQQQQDQQQQGQQQAQQQDVPNSEGASTSTPAAHAQHQCLNAPTQTAKHCSGGLVGLRLAFAGMPDSVARAIAMEVAETSKAAYFIPTVAGFQRRVPWSAAAHQ